MLEIHTYNIIDVRQLIIMSSLVTVIEKYHLNLFISISKNRLG